MSPAGHQMPEPEGDRAARILVVDDDVIVRLAAADHLRDHGFTVFEAANGVEARDVLEAGVEVDLVFSDINMPGGVDGVALAQWIGVNLSETPVVLTSGEQSALDSAQATCPNVRGFVIKPYDYEAIVRRLRAVLALRNTGG